MPNQDRIVGGTAEEAISSQASVVPMRLESQTLSLNLTMRALYKLPGTDFCLNASQPTCRLPDFLTEIQKRQIRVGIRRQELLVTDKPILRAPKKPAALKAQVAILVTPGIGYTVVEEMIKGIVRMSDSDPKLGGHSRYQALDILFKTETEGQSRRNVLEYIASAMDYVPGARDVIDEPVIPDRKGPGRAAPSFGQEPTAEEIGEL